MTAGLWTSRARLTSFAPCRCCRRRAITTRSIANSAGRFPPDTISASPAATAGRRASRSGSPFCMSSRTGATDNVTFGWLRETSNRLANVLRAQGVARGDRVALMLPQTPEVAAAHFAIYKLGAVALPIAILFGPDALAYRLQNSGAKALLTNAQGLAKLEQVRGEVPDVTCVLAVDGAICPTLLARASSDFTAVDTGPDDPAMMIYTSGTTGQPKGALHGHRVLLGHLPGVEMPHYPFPAAGRPLLDAGRLGLGRRAARRAAAEPAPRRAGGGAPLRQVRSGRSLRADGIRGRAQRLHTADGAAHDARGAEPARAPHLQAAHARLRRRVARHRSAGMGQGSLRPHHQRVLRPDRMQSGGRLLRAARHDAARLHGQAGARPHGGGDRPRRRGRSRPARSARSRSSAPTR